MVCRMSDVITPGKPVVLGGIMLDISLSWIDRVDCKLQKDFEARNIVVHKK
jgi:hypothetical protein